MAEAGQWLDAPVPGLAAMAERWRGSLLWAWLSLEQADKLEKGGSRAPRSAARPARWAKQKGEDDGASFRQVT